MLKLPARKIYLPPKIYVHTDEDRLKFNIYEPISTFGVVSKVTEKEICRELLNFLIKRIRLL